jgi:hypothetical protein
MQIITEQIYDIIGPLGTFAGNNVNSSSISDWVNVSAKTVTDMLPNAVLLPYLQSVTTTGNVYDDVYNKRIVRVIQDGVIAESKDVGLESKIVDSDSIHYADATSPVYVIASNGDLKTYPTGAGEATIDYVGYPEVNIYSSSIPFFPESATYAVVLGACVYGLQNIVNYLIHDDQDLELIQSTQVELQSLQALYQAELQRLIS